MAQCKAGANLGGLASSTDRVIETVRIHGDDCQRVVSIGVSLIELDCLECGLHTFIQISSRILRPAIWHYSGSNASEPDVRFWKLRVELASLAEEFARFEVSIVGHLMKMPGPAPHQI